MPLYSDLKNQHVFITGGASGIGAGLVEAFLLQGCGVSMVDIDEEGARRLIDRLNRQKKFDLNKLNFYPVDLLQINALKQAIQQATQNSGPVDILINNAANDQRHETETVKEEKWDELIAINLKPFFFSVQAVIPSMKKQGQGVILNLSSNAYLLGITGYPAYVSAKAGIVGLTKTLARELGEYGIRVNALLPGWVMTEKQKQLWVTDESLNDCLREQCLKTTVEVEDISEIAVFLASRSARMITGQNIVVDGGRV